MSEANFRGITLSFSKTSAIARFLRLCFVDAELQIGTELAKRKQLPNYSNNFICQCKGSALQGKRLAPLCCLLK